MSSTPVPEIRDVLAAYGSECRPTRVEFLGSHGGLSGALFWRLATPLGPLVLRRWPHEHPSIERLEFMQAVLWHAAQQGIDFVPVPLPAKNRKGYVPYAGHLWELAPWLRGRADFHDDPRDPRLAAAMRALARFHLAAADFPLPHPHSIAAPGITHRLARAQRFAAEEAPRLQEALNRRGAARSVEVEDLAPQARQILKLSREAAPRVLRLLRSAAELSVAVEPCLRDIWHDHVLFDGDVVTGLIDFGALRADHVAVDISRLLGSLVGDRRSGWQRGLEAYSGVRPLSGDDRFLVHAYDASTVLMSGWNWIEWLFVEERTFADWSIVRGRIEEIAARLADFTNHAAWHDDELPHAAG